MTAAGQRDHNEDAFVVGSSISSEEHDCIESFTLSSAFTAAAADGVGSIKGGADAARTVVTGLAFFVPKTEKDIAARITELHKSVIAAGKKSGRNGMQCTLAAVCVSADETFYAANVGDSRIYRYNCGTLTQISRDQSLTGMLMHEGRLTRSEADMSDMKNVVFPVVGAPDKLPEPYIVNMGKLNSGDVILICTDGISGALSDFDICEIMAEPMHLKKRIAKIVRTAERTGTDNMTLIGICRAL